MTSRTNLAYLRHNQMAKDATRCPAVMRTAVIRPWHATWLVTASRISAGSWGARKAGSTSGALAIRQTIRRGRGNGRGAPEVTHVKRLTASKKPSSTCTSCWSHRALAGPVLPPSGRPWTNRPLTRSPHGARSIGSYNATPRRQTATRRQRKSHRVPGKYSPGDSLAKRMGSASPPSSSHMEAL